MESPPSFSAHSEAPLLSEDSGLIVTSGSVSSDSVSGWLHIASELQESDYDEKSLSLYDPQDASERMCGDNFNTVKKGPTKSVVPTIKPPPEFQDSPILGKKCDLLNSSQACSSNVTLPTDRPALTPKISMLGSGVDGSACPKMCCDKRHYASPRLLHLSPCHATRPASRSSLSSRLSSSHNSLTTQPQADDSSFITQAISHDTLSSTATDIADMYNVPFDSDIYAVPIDMVRPSHGARLRTKRAQRNYRKRGRSLCHSVINVIPEKQTSKLMRTCNRVTLEDAGRDGDNKRHSIPGPSTVKSNPPNDGEEIEPMHMTLVQVRKYLHTLYSSSSESENRVGHSTTKNSKSKVKSNAGHNNHLNNSLKYNSLEGNLDSVSKCNVEGSKLRKNKKNLFVMNIKNKKPKEVTSIMHRENSEETKVEIGKQIRLKKSPVKNLSLNFKQTLCNLFGLRRLNSVDGVEEGRPGVATQAARRALPPLPPRSSPAPRKHTDEDTAIDFSKSIEKVKDYGWYWGPISVEGAEKILSDEPDGSFIVRDSSDDHYIFTLTFKLNGMRHVRIEHEQGNFCFGSCTMFKAHTIVEFIENAVETSRSGRYLFFLNLRPVLGPMRVQLLYPVSRFKRVQSLQHKCRFVILKVVRRDLINSLPLPRRLLDYLSTPHYYSEILSDF